MSGFSGPSQSSDHNDEPESRAEAEFRRACRDSAADKALLEKVRLDDFLPDVNDPCRLPTLWRLISIDLQRRWTLGKHDLLEVYVQQYPELGSVQDLPVSLIYEEFLVRQRFDPRLAIDEYASRFPEQFAEFRQMVERRGTLMPPSESTATNAHTTMAFDTVLSSPGDRLPEAADEISGTIGQGRYVLEGFLGEGAYAAVWRARAPGGVRVAAKLIKQTVEQLTTQELRSLEVIKDLRNPFLLPVHAYWTENEQLVVITDLADMTLRERLEECQAEGLRGIPADELLGYIHDAAEAIDFLHAQNVIHRDIKPANILLVDKHARVGDFGLVEVLEQRGDVSQDQQLSELGTPLYMPPEAFAGLPCEQSDQYSLAVTYVELRTGKPPFVPAGKTLSGFKRQIREEEPKLKGLDKREQRVLKRALAKDPSQRFPDCRTFCTKLEKAIHPSPPFIWMALIVIFLLAGSSFYRFCSANIGYKLNLPSSVVLTAGGSKNIQLNVTRGLFAPRSFRPEELNSVNQVVFGKWRTAAEAGRNKTFEVTVSVPSRNAGTIKGLKIAVYLTANDKSQKAGEFDLFVERPKAPFPPGFKENKDLPFPEGGPLLHREIYKEVPGCENRVEFRLISHEDLPPFYIMKDKVWNQLFEVFVKNQQLSGDGPVDTEASWRLGTIVNGVDQGVENHPRWPVFRVSVDEAHSFAEWLAGDGDWEGCLPSTAEWDAAAGSPEAPYNPEKWKQDPAGIAINRKDQGPLDVGTAAADVSLHGIRDMAGNGYEWTRDIVEQDSIRKEVPLPKEEARARQGDVWVYLRGMSFARPNPFNFLDFDEPANPYDKPDALTGFRVVVRPR